MRGGTSERGGGERGKRRREEGKGWGGEGGNGKRRREEGKGWGGEGVGGKDFWPYWPGYPPPPFFASKTLLSDIKVDVVMAT